MITRLLPTVPAEEVRRLLGYPQGHAAPERVQSLLDAFLAETSSLLEPRGVMERFAISDAAAVQLPLPGAESSLSGFALGLVTIGPHLEMRTSSALNAGNTTEALLLDAIGSAAVEAAANSLGMLLDRMGEDKAAGGNEGRGELKAQGESRNAGVDDGRGPAFGPIRRPGSPDPATGPASPPVRGLAPASNPPPLPCRISPGYGNWPLAAQKAIFTRLPHRTIGVRLLPSMLMVPQKSITFALWFDPAGHVIASRSGCSRCELEECPRRASRQTGVSA